jgi:hypothetical protein
VAYIDAGYVVALASVAVYAVFTGVRLVHLRNARLRASQRLEQLDGATEGDVVPSALSGQIHQQVVGPRSRPSSGGV